MNPSKLVALAACLASLPACAGTIASPDGEPAPAAAASPSPSAAPAAVADWSCTEPGAPLPMWTHPAALGSQGTLAVHVVEAYTHASVGGVTVRACDASDTTCGCPLAIAQADDAGVATMTVPSADGTFDGYVEVDGREMSPNLVFLDGRAPGLDGFYELTVYTPAALATTETLAGLELDPARGMLRVDTHDCAGAPAAGVYVGVSTSDHATRTAYFAGGGAFSRSTTATDATGLAIVFGVPESSFGVREAVGRTGVGGALAFARAGAVSSVVALP